MRPLQVLGGGAVPAQGSERVSGRGKLRRVEGGWVAFHCPGCETHHALPVEGPRAWSFNGDYNAPSLQPSILVNAGRRNPTMPLCHLYVTDGKIQFLSDCTHSLAGQIVEMRTEGGE